MFRKKKFTHLNPEVCPLKLIFEHHTILNPSRKLKILQTIIVNPISFLMNFYYFSKLVGNTLTNCGGAGRVHQVIYFLCCQKKSSLEL